MGGEKEHGGNMLIPEPPYYDESFTFPKQNEIECIITETQNLGPSYCLIKLNDEFLICCYKFIEGKDTALRFRGDFGSLIYFLLFDEDTTNTVFQCLSKEQVKQEMKIKFFNWIEETKDAGLLETMPGF